MCGIVGIVKLNQRDTVDEARLKRMRDVLRHRGPDGEGLWIEGPVGLGMRRLAIVDVLGGRQPMANEDGTVWIVYNGEVYNHADLRPGLEQRGHCYRTRSDTETILHLYEEEGERCVERLRGMFAFALWDRKRGRLLLARDRLGIKPLYYAWTDQELVFASEIKAILAGGSVRPALNEAILPEFLARGFVAGEETFFRGVHKLLPGRTLAWSCADGPRQRRYWRMPITTDNGAPGTLEACGRDVRVRLAEAVRSHLMSDVPLGLFLSGGIDSSGLAALMAPMVKEPIRTFAVGFADREANELAYARLAARAVGADPRELFFENAAVFPLAVQPHLLSDPDLLSARDPYAEGLRAYEEATGGTLERMGHADVQTYLVELLMKQDQMSMAASIESRVPYLDHEFVERAAAIPGRRKLWGWQTKAVLRDVMRPVEGKCASCG